MTDELIEVNTTWTLKDTNYKVEVIKVTDKKVSYCFLDEFDLITVHIVTGKQIGRAHV